MILVVFARRYDGGALEQSVRVLSWRTVAVERKVEAEMSAERRIPRSLPYDV